MATRSIAVQTVDRAEHEDPLWRMAYDLDNHDGGHPDVSPGDAAAVARHSRAILAGASQISAPHPANPGPGSRPEPATAGPHSGSCSRGTTGSNQGYRTRYERPQPELQRGISYQSASVTSHTCRLPSCSRVGTANADDALCAEAKTQATETKKGDLKNGHAVAHSKNHHLRRTGLTHRESVRSATKNPLHPSPHSSSRCHTPVQQCSKTRCIFQK